MSKGIETHKFLHAVAMCMKRAGDKATSHQVARELDVTPKTALKMLMKATDAGYLRAEKDNHRPNAFKYVFSWTMDGHALCNIMLGYAYKRQWLEQLSNRKKF